MCRHVFPPHSESILATNVIVNGRLDKQKAMVGQPLPANLYLECLLYTLTPPRTSDVPIRVFNSNNEAVFATRGYCNDFTGPC